MPTSNLTPIGTPAIPLLLFPGLAADFDLFAPQREAFPALRVPAWIRPASPRETLIEYARRLAPTIEIPEAGPYVLGGFSFGSQIAQELIPHLPRPPAALALICGVRSRGQFTTRFHIQQRLGAIVPGGIQRALFAPYARQFARTCGLDAHWTQRLVDMARRNDPAFLQWSARACATWPATPTLRHPSRPQPIPVHHIHGEFDRVIPDPTRLATRTIPGAAHLITWTHQAEVNTFLREILADAG